MSKAGPNVLLATENPAKQERLGWLLDGTGLIPVTATKLSLAAPQTTEQGSSHRANAIAKALAWSQACGGLAIASDGGLAVPTLGPDWDALRTRRFFEGDDVGRAPGLLALMAHLEGDDRRAFWVEAVALGDRGHLLHTVEAQSGDGVIARDVDETLIKDGFWVGALWHFPQIGKRYVELTPEELRQVGDHWEVLRELVQAWF